MLVKELRDIISELPDNAKIVISFPNWKRSEIVGHQFVEQSLADNNEPVLFLDIKHAR